MNSRNLLCSLALGAATFLSPGAAAQDAPLTLARAIELAQSRNERALQAEARSDAAEARVARARTFFFPDFDINGTYTRRAYESVRQIGGEDVTIQSFNAINGNATISQTLFDARAFPLLRQARHSFQAARLASAEVRRQVGYEAADAFIITLGHEQVVAAAERRRQFAEEALLDARARFEAGLVSSNDVTRSELELATAERGLAQATGNAEAAYLALGNLLNEPVSALEAPDELLATAAATDPDPDAAIAQAPAQRFDFLALQQSAEALRQFASEPSRRILPRFNFVGQYRRTNEGGLSGRDEDGSAAVTMAWPVFDGGDRYAERAERLALVREAELGVMARGRDIELEIRSATVALRTERASLRAATIAAEAARKNLEETTELYRQGLTGALEVADATTQLFSAEVEEARARYELARAWLVYRAAMGLDPLAGETES
jgi:outer membrane protein TolC